MRGFTYVIGSCAVGPTRNAEAVEDGARRVGAVEGVEMDSGYVVIQEVVALCSCVYSDCRWIDAS
jgi:hypothetical protein